MKNIYEILNQLLTDISGSMPALLTAAGLGDFDVYKLGPSRNPEETGLFIYQDERKYSEEEESQSVFIQLQMFDKKEEISAKYTDVVNDYLKDYNSENIEAVSLREINIDAYPPDQDSTTFIYFNITWYSEQDSCD